MADEGTEARSDRFSTRLRELLAGAAPDSADLELYDYDEDPRETRNLAKARPEVVETLRAILARHPEAVAPGGPARRKGP